MSLSVFENATKVKAKAPATSKKEKEEVAIAGIKKIAVLSNLLTAIESEIKATRVTVDTQVTDHFINKFGAVYVNGKKIKDAVKHENFRGVDVDASASCELRKRSSASALDEFQIEVLTQHGIETEEVGDTIETFIINPKYITDADLMGKVSKALSKIKDLPEDLIQQQVANKKTVTTENSLGQVLNLPPETARSLLAVVGTLAVGKAKLPEEYTVAKLLENVKGILNPVTTVVELEAIEEASKASKRKGKK